MASAIGMNNSSGNVTFETCVSMPPRMYSFGIFGGDQPFKFPLASLQFQMLVIFILTQLIHYPLKKFQFPKILAEIMVGVLLGPTMPEEVTNYTYKLFPIRTQEILDTFTIIGFALLVFLIGVKSDVTLITKVGKKEITIGILTLIVPFIMGVIIVLFLIRSHNAEIPISSMIDVVALQSMTPFSGIALLLNNLKLLNSDLGRLVLSCAAIAEVVNLFFMSIFLVFEVYVSTKSISAAILDFGLLGLFFLVAFLIIRPAMIWVVKQKLEGKDVRQSYLYLTVLLALVACVYTYIIDLKGYLGAFIIGLAIPDGPPLGSNLVYYLDPLISGVFVPLFVTVASSKVDLKLLFTYPHTSSYAMLVPINFSIKLLASFIPAWISNVPVKDALALSLIMCTKGVIELAACNSNQDHQLLKDVTMAVMITTIALTALITTISVKKLYNPDRKYDGYTRRTIMHTKIDAGLKIVACLHRTDNITGFVNLIDASGPTRESPIEIFVLHLIDLHGRASPIFISHHLQRQNSTGFSYSEDVILAFKQLETRKKGAMSAKCFTAISPRKLMHEDIFTLARDKHATFLIVPFHRKWDIQGSVEADDISLRTLNEKIIDISPCSVGIFIDRGLIEKESSHYYVSMIFIGGRDDREALAYAKRIARNTSIALTVIHLVEEEDFHLTGERVLDNEELKEIKYSNNGTKYVQYIELKVRDGPDTTLLLRNMINEYDLMIVGGGIGEERPQTSGLSEWCEFPELGIIGDFLGSIEGKCRASVLIIRQQKQMVY